MKTIERLRELEKAATPGPWASEWIYNVNRIDGGRLADKVADCGPVSHEPDATKYCVANARLIATTRNALPALLAVVEAQAAEIEAWRDLWDAMKKDRNGPNTQKLLKKLAAEEKTDAALRALEGGVG